MPGYTLEGPRWTARVVTWSLAAAGDVFSSAIGPAYEAVVQQAMALWDDAAGVTLVQVADGDDADMRIGFGLFGASAGQIGETSYSYINGMVQAFIPGVTVQAEDPAERQVGSDGLYAATQTSLAQVVLHEIGHALGLGHSSGQASVMHPVATAANRTLDATDLDGIRALYGAPAFTQTNTTSGVSNHPDGESYAGPATPRRCSAMPPDSPAMPGRTRRAPPATPGARSMRTSPATAASPPPSPSPAARQRTPRVMRSRLAASAATPTSRSSTWADRQARHRLARHRQARRRQAAMPLRPDLAPSPAARCPRRPPAYGRHRPAARPAPG